MGFDCGRLFEFEWKGEGWALINFSASRIGAFSR